MAPIATQTQTQTLPTEQFHSLKLRGPSPPSAETSGRSTLTQPLKYFGSLEKYTVSRPRQPPRHTMTYRNPS